MAAVAAQEAAQEAAQKAAQEAAQEALTAVAPGPSRIRPQMSE
jgi:hypothetical protein